MKQVVAAVLVLCMGMLLLAGCGPTHEKSCYEQSEKYLTQLNALIQRYSAATSAGGEAIGTATQKDDILVAISDLEDVKKNMRSLDPPSCAHDLQAKSIALVDTTMDAFWLVAAGSSNTEIAAAIEVMNEAGDDWSAAYSAIQTDDLFIYTIPRDE